MNTILNKIGATRVTPARFFGFWAILFTLVLALTSCSDDLDVQQSYPFKYDGEGTLKLVDGPVLVNNDRVLLESKTFRLNYTAQSSEAHKFLIVVEDSFNSTPWQQTFEFNSKDSGDNDGGKTPGIINPVNPGTITPIGL